MLAYFDAFSGISGDMALGALIDLGVPVAWLDARLRDLGLAEFTLTAERVFRRGIRATKATVTVQDGAPARGFADIAAFLQESALSETVKTQSLKIFDRIAEAESLIHGCPKDQVHFHEVGAVDALVDVVGTCLGLEYLGIREVFSSSISLGTGWVDCAHGRLPVPAPATLEILKGVPVGQTEIPRELTTPTGAALVVSLASGFGRMPAVTVEQIGYGAGTRDLPEQPNVLRVALGRRPSIEGGMDEPVTVVECAVDDMNPEIFGYLMERLFEDGARDVYWIPVFMKKNRPGTLIQVLCKEDRREAVLKCLLTETPTLGVRFTETRRRILPRAPVTVDTPYGRIEAKRVRDLNGTWRIVPEYDACKRVAAARGIPLKDVFAAVQAAADPEAVSS